MRIEELIIYTQAPCNAEDTVGDRKERRKGRKGEKEKGKEIEVRIINSIILNAVESFLIVTLFMFFCHPEESRQPCHSGFPSCLRCASTRPFERYSSIPQFYQVKSSVGVSEVA